MEFRPPREGDWPACRMLLPEAFARGAMPEVLLAIENAPSAIVGAAAFQCGQDSLHSVRIRVVRTHRRRGIGSALLRRLVREARQRGARALTASVGSEPDAVRFLAGHGWTRVGRLTMVEADVEPIYQFLAGLRERLLSAGKVPPNARIAALAEADRDEVVRLYSQYILPDPDLPAVAIRRSLESGSLDRSAVLLVDGRLEGMILWELQGELGIVHARVVTPAYQGGWGWANALLMETALGWGRAAGGRRVRFDWMEDNRDTLTLARRFQVEVVRTLDRYTLRLAPEVTVVSGLPRSGTSLMMQMLAAGGMEVLADGQRAADESNPRGYFEFEPVKATARDASWVAAAEGKAVKVIYALVRHLPADRDYSVILMRRPMAEVIASQRAMLARAGRRGATVPDDQLARAFAAQLSQLESWLAEQPRFRVLAVDYHDCLEQPLAAAAAVNRFVGGRLDERAMSAAVDATLWRQKLLKPVSDGVSRAQPAVTFTSNPDA